jgi:hypothetical protein
VNTTNAKRWATRSLRLGAILILAASMNGQAGGNRLAGCSDPEALAAALVKLHETDWRDLSLAGIQAIWPTHLEPLDCGAEDCRSVLSQGRTIQGHCVCCEVFEFELKPDEDNSRGGQLHNVIIHYTTQQRKETVGVAKKFAKAMGLSDAEVATVGDDRIQNFGWWNTRQNQIEHFGMEIHFIRQGHLWELYLAMGRDVISSHSAGLR